MKNNIKLMLSLILTSSIVFADKALSRFLEKNEEVFCNPLLNLLNIFIKINSLSA